jgi:hypothetical protein
MASVMRFGELPHTGQPLPADRPRWPAAPGRRHVGGVGAHSGHIVRSYRTRGRPRDVVAAGNHVWVATTEPNELVSFSGAAAR